MLTRWVMAVWFGRSLPGRLMARMLMPWSLLTRWYSRRTRRTIERLPPPPIPLLVVGNLLAGGTGKTPLIIALARKLNASGLRVGLLCSGYGARRSHARLVRGDGDAAEDGDEAVMLAAESGLPVAAARRRDHALQCLLAAHADLDLVISDDGLQHRHLARTLELVVFDRRGLGNGKLLPAGPLRESLPADGYLPAIALNDAPIPPGIQPGFAFGFRIRAAGLTRVDRNQGLTVDEFRARHSGQALCALAGIGDPDRFFEMLERLGLHPTRRIPLPDHAPIAADDLGRITEPLIVMTAKDAVKCRPYADDRCWVLHVEAEPDPRLVPWLRGALLGKQTA